MTSDDHDGPLRFGVVGSGWRAGFFLRMAEAMPQRFRAVGVVTRTAERGAETAARWGVPAYRSTRALVAAQRPELVVVAVPREAAPRLTTELVETATPVLTETPPAPDLTGMRELWARVGSSGLVQVAEHMPVMPAQVAVEAVVRAGSIGAPTSVQISATHQYHAVSVVRRVLGAGYSPVTVHARRFSAPLVDPVSRGGWTGDPTSHDAATVLGLMDLGKGRSALYDYTDNQWRNPLRANRLVVRGSRGEIVGDRVTRLVDERTVVTSPLVRRHGGIEQGVDWADLEHISFEGEVLYRNPYVGAHLSDDDIAVAALLDATGAWVRGHAPPPYPLAEGLQDHLVGLALGRAAETGEPVTTTTEAWSADPAAPAAPSSAG